MFETYEHLYKIGGVKASELKEIVTYLTEFGLTPLDYEKITGKSWNDEESKTTEEAKTPEQS
ncbi:hypothetical protein LIX87_00040 [Weissella viridescens]|uniref:hypothetical protein n=1 Tax=Weissella viridescens TaxID=1629 RepID=UPI001D084065|nr:hypothetical protein [Weissella viridescens]MCB6839405.1 hypothetical protein [Weissella viridescens]MCB6846136.1 hypothetical protein [Weissella viridescens]